MAISPVSVPTSGNDFELMRNGTRYSELLFRDIEAAGKSIDLEVLLFCEDKEGLRVRDSLLSKVRQGVEVRYIYDNFGNFFDSIFDGRPLFGGFHRSIGKGGVKVRSFSPLWAPDYTYTTPGCRNHRKINVIDDKIAYIGGMNFSEGSMAGWGDTQLRITGPAVQSIEGLFVSDWNRLAGKKDSFTLSVEGPETDGGGKILQVIPDGHDQPAYMMEEVFRWLLENAREYIWF